jgi:hypothetical protein
MKKIKITIDPEGNPKYELSGYQGTECEEVQQAMARVGTVHNLEQTAEACPAVQPAYNELHRNQ